MTSKFTRPALAAVAAAGASGLVAASAQAAVSIPTSLVNQPAVTGAVTVTPESAVLTGVVDTGGSQQTTFQLSPGSTLSWDGGSFNLVNTGSSPVTEYVDGIPTNNTASGVYTTVGAAPYQIYPVSNGGADNNSSVLFEYDPYSDYVANNNSPGPQTTIATEVDVPTAAGISPARQLVGAFPAAAGSTTGNSPLRPNTKYAYWIVQQAGVTNAAETINTAIAQGKTAPSSTAVNPTWTCYPLTFIKSVAPYNSYTSTGTVSGGVTSSGAAQATPQPQIQGPCVYTYGGSSNYYESATGTFKTPKLGSVKFGSPTLKGNTLWLTATVNSVEPAKGKVTLSYHGRTVAGGSFSAASGASKQFKLKLTKAGSKAISGGKKISAKLAFATVNDQPSATKSVRF